MGLVLTLGAVVAVPALAVRYNVARAVAVHAPRTVVTVRLRLATSDVQERASRAHYAVRTAHRTVVTHRTEVACKTLTQTRDVYRRCIVECYVHFIGQKQCKVCI